MYDRGLTADNCTRATVGDCGILARQPESGRRLERIHTAALHFRKNHVGKFEA